MTGTPIFDQLRAERSWAELHRIVPALRSPVHDEFTALMARFGWPT